MSDSTDSSYSSEGVVLCSYTKTFDSTSSSDEPGESDTGDDIQSLVYCLSQQEKANLQNTIKHGISKQKGKVFPEVWGSFVSSKYKKLSENIIAVAGVRESWVFGIRSLLEQMIEDRTKPKHILCDVCFFSSTNPLLVLTFMTSSAKTSSIMDYNSHLARTLIRTVQSGGEINFDVVNGIVDPDRYQQTSLFLEKVNQIESECKKTAIPNSLYMDEDRYRSILSTFLSVGQIFGKDVVQAGARVAGAVGDLQQENKDATVKTGHLEHSGYEDLLSNMQDLTFQSDAELKEEQVDMKEFRKMKQKVLQLQKDMSVLKWQLVGGTTSSSDTGFESYETAPESLTDTTEDADHMSLAKPVKTRLDKSVASVGGDTDQPEQSRRLKKRFPRPPSTSTTITSGYNQPERSRRLKKRFPRPPSPSTTITSGYMESSGGNSETDILSDTETLQDEETHTDTRPRPKFQSDSSSQEKRSPSTTVSPSDSSSQEKRCLSTTVSPSDSSSQEKRSLIQAQSPPDSKTYYSVLYDACRDGKLMSVKSILSCDTRDINRKGPRGRTPVMVAALKSHREVFDLLVSKGADLSVVDDNKSTILHVACLRDNVEFVKYLLTLNIADINVRGQYGRTPVMYAAQNGCRRVFDLLVSRGTDLSVVNDNKSTILHVACLNDNVEFVKYLLTLNIADINVRGQYGRTPVMNAAQNGCRGVFDLLVSKGADLSVVDDINHYNILHVACMGGNVEVVKYLLSLDTLDINRTTRYGRTPAMIARKLGNKEIYDLLNGSQV